MSIEALTAKAPKRARGVQRVAELLDAGAALFAEHGYDATTMTQIALRAGASIGSLYQFFPSKEALAEALFGRYVERMAVLLGDMVKRAHGLSPAQLADLLVDLMLEVRSDRDAVAALSASVEGIAERRKPRGATRRQIAAILRSANPKLSEKPAAAAAVMIAHVIKTVPTLAKEEEESGQALVAEVRKLLSAYIERVIRR
jgi:AcrR family transcriptional regulator